MAASGGLLPDDAPVVGLISVGGDAVIGVHPVGHRLTVRRKTPEGEGGVVQQGSVGGRLHHRHRVARTEEQQHFVQPAVQIVPSGG